MTYLDRADLHGSQIPAHMVLYLRWAWERGLLDPRSHDGSAPTDDAELLDCFDGKPNDQDFTDEGWAFSAAYYTHWLYEVVADSGAAAALLDGRLAQWRAGNTESWPKLPPPRGGLKAWQVLALVVPVVLIVAGPYTHAVVSAVGWLAGGLAAAAACVVRWRRSRGIPWRLALAGIPLIVLAALLGSSTALALGFLGLCLEGAALILGLLRR